VFFLNARVTEFVANADRSHGVMLGPRFRA
jgi:hypothetical protein